VRPRETVVITGASAGVGRATACAFAKRGARIGLVARDRDRLNTAADEVRDAGGEALPLSADVADADAVGSAADAVERQFGPIDIWVNNAMATIFAPVSDISPAEYRRATEVTYLGCVHGTMAALKSMLPRDHGTIVQVGSALAYRAIPLQAPYCGAKHAIRGFTNSLRTELLHKRSRIQVTMVQLPALNTPQFDWARNKMPRRPRPLGAIFQPELAAAAILYAAYARRREVYVGGSTLMTVLGSKLMPGLFEHFLARKAYDGQLSDETVPPERAGNLVAPLPGDWRAHGRFDAEARNGSLEFDLVRQRGLLAAAAGGAVGFLAALLWAPRAAARPR
jgi:short-subunit dehydrogenase